MTLLSEYVVGYSGTACRSSIIRWEEDAAYDTFLEHHYKNRKPEQVAKCWYWKDLVILVEFVVIVVLCYKIV
jgi:hypothetical protein